MISKNPETHLYDVEIDGKTYSFEKWGAEESLDVLIDIGSIIGGSLGQAVGQIFSGKKDENLLDKQINPDMLATVFEGLSKNLKKEICKPIIKKLASEKVLCDGKKVNFNIHYQEDLFHMFRVVKAGLEVQYGNFFDAAKDVAALVAPKQQAVMNRT